MKKLSKALIFILFIVSGIASAETNTIAGKITSYHTGWSIHAVRVTIHGATYSEVAECSTKDGYMISKDINDTEGFSTHTSALLTAFASGKPVILTVEGCTVDRPKIIGVTILIN